MMVDSVTVDSASAESPCQRRTRRACTKGAVAQAQDSVHVRRGTKVTSEDDSKDQHLRNSFDILKRWRTGRWSKAPCNDHLKSAAAASPINCRRRGSIQKEATPWRHRGVVANLG